MNEDDEASNPVEDFLFNAHLQQKAKFWQKLICTLSVAMLYQRMILPDIDIDINNSQVLGALLMCAPGFLSQIWRDDVDWAGISSVVQNRIHPGFEINFDINAFRQRILNHPIFTNEQEQHKLIQMISERSDVITMQDMRGEAFQNVPPQIKALHRRIWQQVATSNAKSMHMLFNGLPNKDAKTDCNADQECYLPKGPRLRIHEMLMGPIRLTPRASEVKGGGGAAPLSPKSSA